MPPALTKERVVTKNGEMSAEAMLNASFTSANRLIERMVESKILVEGTGNVRNRVFGYSQYIDLFS